MNIEEYVKQHKKALSVKHDPEFMKLANREFECYGESLSIFTEEVRKAYDQQVEIIWNTEKCERILNEYKLKL